MNKKTNQRYQTTHNLILNAVLKFLESKDLSKITIADICRTTGINRSSFYLHYADIPDVIDKTNREYSQELAEIINKNLPISRYEASVATFDFIKAHKNFYIIFLKLGRKMHIPNEMFSNKIIERKQDVSQRLWPADPYMADYQWKFMQGSVSAIIEEWIIRDCKESYDQIFNILKRLSGVW